MISPIQLDIIHPEIWLQLHPNKMIQPNWQIRQTSSASPCLMWASTHWYVVAECLYLSLQRTRKVSCLWHAHNLPVLNNKVSTGTSVGLCNNKSGRIINSHNALERHCSVDANICVIVRILHGSVAFCERLFNMGEIQGWTVNPFILHGSKLIQITQA